MGAVCAALVLVELAPQVFTDFEIFRAGGLAALHGESIYDLHIGSDGTPFVYPPFAAVLMIPFALLSLNAGFAVWTVLTGAAVFGSAWLLARHLPVLSGGAVRPDQWLWTLIITTGCLVSEPFFENMRFGQINVFLMLMILVDVLAVSASRWSGVLTGLAAAIKVMPGYFIVLMLTTRRWADAVRASAALAVTIVIGALFGWRQEWEFWTHDLLNAGDIMGSGYFANVGLKATLERWLPEGIAVPLWLIAAAAVLLYSLYLATRWWPADPLVAVSVLALGLVLAEPLSWDHHWVWFAPVSVSLFALWRRARAAGDLRSRRWYLAALVAVLVTSLIHIRQLEYVFLHNKFMFNVVDSVYAVAGLLALAAFTFARKPGPLQR